MRKLNEDTSGGMVGAMTSSGNPQVSYLPGNFSSVKNYLHSLAPLKKQWNLTQIEEGENFRLCFEDALDIVVPKTAYDEFSEKVLKVKGKKSVNLLENLFEDIHQEIEANLQQVKQLLSVGLRKKPEINRAITLVNFWIKLFPHSTFQPKQNNTLFSLNNYGKDVEEVLEYLRKLYGDELSQLENLVHTLKQGEPLNSLPPFKKYSFLVGNTIRTDYQNTLIQFESAVGMSSEPVQTIRIPGDETILEELRAVKGTKIVRDSLVPVNLSFTPNQLLLVKKIVDDEINKEVKQVKK
jgi:hypothetical protein